MFSSRVSLTLVSTSGGQWNAPKRLRQGHTRSHPTNPAEVAQCGEEEAGHKHVHERAGKDNVKKPEPGDTLRATAGEDFFSGVKRVEH